MVYIGLMEFSFDYVNIYAIDFDEGSQIYFFYDDSGYVKTDDWIDVDPDKFINDLRKKLQS